jgi:hypothetical protein
MEKGCLLFAAFHLSIKDNRTPEEKRDRNSNFVLSVFQTKRRQRLEQTSEVSYGTAERIYRGKSGTSRKTKIAIPTPVRIRYVCIKAKPVSGRQYFPVYSGRFGLFS